MFVCPQNKPFLHEKPNYDGHKVTSITLCCSNTNKSQLNIMTNQQPNDITTVTTITHDTDIVIRDYNKVYTLYSYNKPSTYNRNYYVYVVYDYDTVNNKLIAFSI